MIGIYKFTNKLTGESYIGQSTNLRKRYIQHKNRHDKFGKKTHAKEDTYFHSMLRHYGFHNFEYEVLEECTKEQLNAREMYYIEFYNSLYPNGYNRTHGGNSPHTLLIKDFDTVNEIKELLKTSLLTNIEIGKMYGVSDQSICDINSGRTWFDDNTEYPIRGRRRLGTNIENAKSRPNRKSETHSKVYCKNCGKEITKYADTHYCQDCYKVTTRKVTNRPDKDTLYALLTRNSFKKVGSMYGISDNAVRKWCDSYGIPRDSKYYRSLSSQS